MSRHRRQRRLPTETPDYPTIASISRDISDRRTRGRSLGVLTQVWETDTLVPAPLHADTHGACLDWRPTARRSRAHSPLKGWRFP